VSVLSTVPPEIVRNFDKVYNMSDVITCSAEEGYPRPMVKWSHVSGSIPIITLEQSGEGQAVLRNLYEGDHVWQCTAKNDYGSDKVTVEFTGKLPFTVFLCLRNSVVKNIYMCAGMLRSPDQCDRIVVGFGHVKFWSRSHVKW